MEIIPSVFSTNEKEYAERFEIASSLAKRVHVDVMDGKFVKSKSPSLNSLKTKKGVEVHLMVKHPQDYLDSVIKLGAKRVYLHLESHKTPQALLQNIFTFKEKRIQVGIAVSPKTKVEEIKNYLEEIESVLLMSVNPGKEGQKFLSGTYDKIARVREMTKKEIGVDGGIDKKILQKIEKMGVDFAVAGSAIFK